MNYCNKKIPSIWHLICLIDKMAVILGDILDSNAYIISSDGSVLGFVETHDVNNERIKKMFVEKQFPKNYTSFVDNLSSTEANVPSATI